MRTVLLRGFLFLLVSALLVLPFWLWRSKQSVKSLEAPAPKAAPVMPANVQILGKAYQQPPTASWQNALLQMQPELQQYGHDGPLPWASVLLIADVRVSAMAVSAAGKSLPVLQGLASPWLQNRYEFSSNTRHNLQWQTLKHWDVVWGAGGVGDDPKTPLDERYPAVSSVLGDPLGLPEGITRITSTSDNVSETRLLGEYVVPAALSQDASRQTLQKLFSSKPNQTAAKTFSALVSQLEWARTGLLSALMQCEQLPAGNIQLLRLGGVLLQDEQLLLQPLVPPVVAQAHASQTALKFPAIAPLLLGLNRGGTSMPASNLMALPGSHTLEAAFQQAVLMSATQGHVLWVVAAPANADAYQALRTVLSTARAQPGIIWLNTSSDAPNASLQALVEHTPFGQVLAAQNLSTQPFSLAAQLAYWQFLP